MTKITTLCEIMYAKNLHQIYFVHANHVNEFFPFFTSYTFDAIYSAFFLCVCVSDDLQDLTYAELMVTSPVQRVHFTSTLGRPRTSSMKQQEPTIYAQVSFSLDYPYTTSLQDISWLRNGAFQCKGSFVLILDFLSLSSFRLPIVQSHR